MGLAERRATQEFETNDLPALKAEINSVVGYELPIEIAWQTIQDEDRCDRYKELWTEVYFRPLTEALRNICIDDLGKQAVKENLKKVVIQNTRSSGTGEYIASYAEGVLTLDHEPATNLHQVSERRISIQSMLESNL